MSTRILRPAFELIKIKLLKDDAGVFIEYNVKTNDSGATNKDNNAVKCPVVPHPDLIESIKKLDVFLARTNGYLDLKTVIPNMELTGDQRQTCERLMSNTVRKIRATGLSLSGEDKNFGVVITGKFACDNKIDIAINSPRIVLSRDVFKFEIELSELIDRIIEEAYCYRIEGKRSAPQLPLPGESVDQPKSKKKSKNEAPENQTSLVD